MQQCPHCGDEVNALKNHVRLTKGDGHGPSGEYPDGFNDGVEPDQKPDSADRVDSDRPEQETAHTPTEQPERDSQESTPKVTAGIVPPEDQHEPTARGSTGEQTADQTADEPDSTVECPGCGCEKHRPASEHLADYRDRLTEFHVRALEAYEHLCLSCGAPFNADGSDPEGFEDVDASDAPPSSCEGCGSENYVATDYYLGRFNDRLSSDDAAALRGGDIVCLDCGAVCA